MKAFENLLKQEEKIYEIKPKNLLNPELIQNCRINAKESKETTIYDCLWLFTKNEILQGDNGYLCEKCSHLFEDVIVIEEEEEMKENEFEDEKEEGFPIVNNEEEPKEEENETKENESQVISKEPKEETTTKENKDESQVISEEPKEKTSSEVILDESKENIQESNATESFKHVVENSNEIKQDSDIINSKKTEEIEKIEKKNDHNNIIKIPRKASKQFSFFESPNVLTLHLKRFLREDERKNFKKDDSIVKFPLNLNLNCFMNPSTKEIENSQNYSLYAIVEHSGGIGSGHYICYVKRIIFKKEGGFKRDQWFRISDSNTREATEK